MMAIYSRLRNLVSRFMDDEDYDIPDDSGYDADSDTSNGNDGNNDHGHDHGQPAGGNDQEEEGEQGEDDQHEGENEHEGEEEGEQEGEAEGEAEGEDQGEHEGQQEGEDEGEAEGEGEGEGEGDGDGDGEEPEEEEEDVGPRVRLFPYQDQLDDTPGLGDAIERCEDLVNQFFQPQRGHINIEVDYTFVPDPALGNTWAGFLTENPGVVPVGYSAQYMTRAIYKEMHSDDPDADWDLFPQGPDAEMRMSDDADKFYLGTDGEVPDDKWEFITACVHEAMHAIFMNSDGLIVDNQLQSAAFNPDGRRDRFSWYVGVVTEDHRFCNIHSYEHDPINLYKALTSNRLWFGNGGERLAKLYAPSQWNYASSLIHTEVDPNIASLMEPELSVGVDIRWTDQDTNFIMHTMRRRTTATVDMCHNDGDNNDYTPVVVPDPQHGTAPVVAALIGVACFAAGFGTYYIARRARILYRRRLRRKEQALLLPTKPDIPANYGATLPRYNPIF